MSLMRHTVMRCAANSRVYTLREAVAVAEAQSILSSSSSPPPPSALPDPSFHSAPFTGCDPLRGAYQAILSDPQLAAEVRTAHATTHQSPAHAHIQGVVTRVEVVSRQDSPPAESTPNAGAPTPRYHISLFVELPILSPSTEPSVSRPNTPLDNAVLEVRGHVTLDTLPLPDHGDEAKSRGRLVEVADAEKHIADVLNRHLVSRRVELSGRLRREAEHCYVSVQETDLLTSLHLLPQ